VGTVSELALRAALAIAGSHSPQDQVMRGLVWALLAGVVGVLTSVARSIERRFLTGDYPPQRNTAKDP
jgi:hypothetical protein